MNRVVRRVVPALVAGAAAFATGPALAQVGANAQASGAAVAERAGDEILARFVERPGVLEFTGRMIVRPRQDLYGATNPRPDASPASPWKPGADAALLRDGATDAARARLMPHVIEHFGEVDEYTVRVPAGMDENSFAQQLMATGDYEYAHPDWLCYTTDTVPDDPRFSDSWQHTRIQSTLAWDLFTGDPSTVVAIVDSGVDLDHPDLIDRLVPGFNSQSDTAQADGGFVDDQNGHGTFCAGCAAATGNNGRSVVGVGWNLGVMPIRATAPGTGGTAFSSDLNQGARWAADNGAATVNVSFSGVDSASVQTTGAYCKDRDVLYFRSAGNDGRNLSGFDHPDVVVVGASTINDTRAGFSAFGRAVDLTAPGDGVRGTTAGGGSANSSGTSFSSPIAAGVAAMIMGANPSLDIQEVEDILFETCDPIGSENTFGNGRVNTFEAVKEALNPGDLELSLPGAVAEAVEPGAPTDLTVLVAIEGDTLAATPEMRFRRDGDAGFTAAPMTETAPGQWTATLPAMACGDDPEVYFFAEGVAEGVTTLPAGGESEPFRVLVGELTFPFADNFETDLGWTVSGDASDGQWTRGVPAGDGDRSDPTVDADGSGSAYLTDNVAGNSDVDGGSTILTSPVFDFTGGGTIQWQYWMDDSAGAALNSGDGLFVELSSNGGSTWDRFVSYTDGFPEWRQGSIEIPAVFASDSYRIRFIATDAGAGSLLEAGVDGVRFVQAECADEPACPADFNDDGAVNVVDVLDFINVWNVEGTGADFNDDGSVNIVDVVDFITVWNLGCP